MSRRCTNSIAPTSRPRVGWAASSSSRLEIDLARQDELLLVAARECARRRAGDPPRTSKRSISRFARLEHRPRVQPAEPRDRRSLVVVQRGVLGDAEIEHEAVSLPILGDVPDARLGGGCARRRMRQVAVARAGSCPPRPCACPASASASSACPLPSTPAMPTISPARTSRVRPRDRLDVAVVQHVQVVERRAPASPGCAAPPLDLASSTGRPTISSARPRCGGAGCVDRRDDLRRGAAR